MPTSAAAVQEALTPLDEVRERSGWPGPEAAFSPLGERPLLLFEADCQALPLTEQERIAQWLWTLRCPAIGIAAEDSAGPVIEACDARVASAPDAALIAQRIRKAPLAASVFVQLLRANEDAPLESALNAESLAYAMLQSGPEFRRWLAGRQADAPVEDSGPPVLVERRDERLEIALNRPSSRNAISVPMRDALVEALQLVLCDETIRLARVSGRGKCFSVGGELAEFGTAPDPATGYAVRSLTLPARLVAACGERIEFRLHGACIGSGIEMPSFAKRIVAAPDTWVQLPELEFGLIPGAGGCVGIPDRVGRQRTAWLVLSGKRIDAATALDWGLVDEIAG